MAKHVLDDLGGRIDAILDAGSTNIGVESTVLDLTVVPPQVLRPGGTPFEALKETLHNVKLNPAVTTEEALPIEKARSPGMKHKHYAPDAEVLVVEGEMPAVIRKVNELALMYMRRQRRVGILCMDETAQRYEAEVVKSLGSRSDLASVARSLFRSLRDFDAEKIDVIVAEGTPIEGLGLAVLNRLRKAAGYRIIKA
jgi:L-threonylcarbamoyladenylate synthase